MMIEVNKLINEILEFNSTFKIVDNTIEFTFFPNESDQVYISLYINPFWRFSNKGEIILSSFHYPIDEESSLGNESSEKLNSWYEPINYLTSIPLKEIKFGSEINDLIIHWIDGTKLEVLQDDNENEVFWIRDNAEKMKYFVFPNEIIKYEELD
jgi:hypothetical protein